MKPYMTIEEIIAVPRLSGPTLSPDGSKVAFMEMVADWDKNEYRRYCKLYDSGQRTTTYVSSGETQSHSPLWSPSGVLTWISPVKKGEESSGQVFALFQGRSVQLTEAKPGVTSYRWSPDGRGIYYVAPDPVRKEELKRRKERYGDFVYAEKDYVLNCLYYLEIPGDMCGGGVRSLPKDLRKKQGGTERKLAGGDRLHVTGFAVSPDSTKIVFSAAPSPDSEDSEDLSLYLLDVAEGTFEELPIAKPLSRGARALFSPSGEEICYTRPINEGKWFNIDTLEIRDLASGRTRQPLPDLDESPDPIAWTEEGLYFTLQQKTDWYVCRLDGEGRLHHVCAEPGSVTMDASVSDDGKSLATLTATRDMPLEIYLDGERITDQSRHFAQKTLTKKEVVEWESRDGTPIQGILITPPDLDPNKSYPLLVQVHGGPTGTALAIRSAGLNYPQEAFVERGIIILDVNYRGSAGYGEKFRKLNYRNLGIGDYEDVVSGVDMLVKKGLADNSRVGVMGWSQGGYISAMCTTYSQRFKAVSVGAGISSWYTYYASTDIPPFTRYYLGDTPWADMEIYVKTSPISYISGANTPTLIQHGESDHRVPYANARELQRGLKDMGVPVQLVTFKGMAHGANKPGLHRAIMKQNYAWFCHHLMGDELDGLWLAVDEKAKDQ